MATLGVNIDHVATVREARQIDEPDPLQAAEVAEAAGCHGITVHLREDRRHIQDEDVFALRKQVKTKLNLELSVHPDILRIAQKLRPDQVTFVPEHRDEVTTEGGLNLMGSTKYRECFKNSENYENLENSEIQDFRVFLVLRVLRVFRVWKLGKLGNSITWGSGGSMVASMCDRATILPPGTPSY